MHRSSKADGLSPRTASAEEELTSRALLDAALRALQEPAVSLADIIKRASRGDVLYRCPMLSSRLRAWSDARQSLRASQMPSDWAPALSQVLQAIGWPGDRGLNSSEYQTLEVWNELLSELASLDSVTGRIPLDTAVGLLRRLASSRQFQPESEPAPLQILGVFESSGLRFDRLWIMGMHDNAWPPAPDPFLPFRLQRRFNLPRCSPDRELEFTQVLTTRLLASAPTVVVSYPQREDDSDLRVSPLFRALPEVAVDDLGLLASARYVEQLHGSSRMETLEDHHGPPCDDAALNGGMSLFKLQAACPFKAFAELRLGAKALDQPEPGLSALDRGQLIHRILERIWQELESHEGLLSTPADRLEAIVRTIVCAEVQGLSQRRRGLRRPRFSAIEQVRLERVIEDWLLLEMKRRPFTVLEQEENRPVTVSRCGTRSGLPRPASSPRSAAAATRMTVLAESVIGLYKTEVINRRGPWRHVEAVELATLEWAIGSTTGGFSPRSATSLRSSAKSSTIGVRRLQLCWPESRNQLSGKPGTVHYAGGHGGRDACAGEISATVTDERERRNSRPLATGPATTQVVDGKEYSCATSRSPLVLLLPPVVPGGGIHAGGQKPC